MPDSRRDAILEAAVDAVSASGFDAVSVEAIRRAAHASTGSLYHHFPTRGHLMAAVYERLIRSYQAALLSVLDEHVEVEAGVRAVVDFHVRWCIEHAGEARLLFDARPPRPGEPGAELVERANREFVSDLWRWYRPHIHYGAVRDLPVEVTLALWLGPAQELCRFWLGGGSDRSPAYAIPILAEAAWRGLMSPEAKGSS